MIEPKPKKKDCVVKRLYDSGTPYIQGGGWMSIAGGLAYAIWLLFEFGVSQTQAFVSMQQNFYNMHDQVIQMKQEIDDIHEWTKP